eukprot:CAMPEP_0113516166 /NCGR_PEP_ID=MMETSP0014_2-20120614/41385_1 /TAXON_ID=2857 /ORGANISM="Nitzschia sp." /LENGTH=497 /DNA_ID=CAMNT_0000412887 /DNA_START=109 /DNA_END=1599 /DNA_ORIENTATION=+ /assembly_acc=CAM_ASM_000159
MYASSSSSYYEDDNNSVGDHSRESGDIDRDMDPDEKRQLQERHNQLLARRRRKRLVYKYLTFSGLSVVYWVVLFIVAASYNPGDHKFTLNVGETWKIEPPSNLWSRRSLNIKSFNTNPGLEVYEVLPVLDGPNVEAVCPPLQGPSLMLREPKKSLKLNYQQYEYDFFHLNEGSIITVDATIEENHDSGNGTTSNHHGTGGAVNIYILQGYDALTSLVSGGGTTNVGFQNFRGASIFKQYFGNAPGQTEPRTHVEYPVMASDFFVVVYDNAAPGVTRLDVMVSVRLATHYLESKLPICSANVTANGCSWAMMNSADRQRIKSTCLLVKAVSHKEYQQEIQQKQELAQLPGSSSGSGSQSGGAGGGSDLELDDTHVVLVEVDARLGSDVLILLACVPLAVVIVLLTMEENCLTRCIFYVCGCCRGGRTNNDDTTEGLAFRKEETIPLKGDLPLPPSLRYGGNGTVAVNNVLVRTETPKIQAHGLVPIGGGASRRTYNTK